MGKPEAAALIQDEDGDALLRSVEAARKSLDAGDHIRHEDMRRWLLSWGTEHELPPPSRWT